MSEPDGDVDVLPDPGAVSLPDGGGMVAADWSELPVDPVPPVSEPDGDVDVLPDPGAVSLPDGGGMVAVDWSELPVEPVLPVPLEPPPFCANAVPSPSAAIKPATRSPSFTTLSFRIVPSLSWRPPHHAAAGGRPPGPREFAPVIRTGPVPPSAKAAHRRGTGTDGAAWERSRRDLGAGRGGITRAGRRLGRTRMPCHGPG